MFAPLAFLTGAASWTALEYTLHRFVGHGPRRRPPATLVGRLSPSGFLGAFNHEHLAHHADHRYFAPTRQKVAAAAVVTTAAAMVGSALLGPRRGLSFALGLGGMYVGYEVMHRRVHTHGPRGDYQRWMWRHHLFHHFKSPRRNHGVTSPLWDRGLGTEVEVREKIRIPRRHAPDWLLDGQGDVRPEYAQDYEVAPAQPGMSARANATYERET
jgi:hypothetical protein